MEESYVIKNVINKQLLNECIDFCKEILQYPENITDDPKWYKKGLLHEYAFVQEKLDPLIREYLHIKDAKLIGDTAFLLTFPPHDIHVDNKTNKFPKTRPYKTVVVPVYVEGDIIPKFYTANQYFFGEATTRFRHGSKERDEAKLDLEQRRKDGIHFVYDYDNILVGLEDTQVITREWYDKNIDAGEAVKFENFDRLSIEKEHDWKPGDIIIFDSHRLHFAQNLRKINCKYKIGISLNYALDD